MKDIDEIFFPGKEPNEKIIMMVRRHKVVIVKRLVLVFIAGFLPVLAYLGVTRFTEWLDDPAKLLYLVLVFLASLFYLYWLLMLYESWVNYYLDVWIITDERIIAMEQISLFHRDVSELRLNTIQDVSSDAHGIMASIFQYGNILVQTASAEERFRFMKVPHPEIIARKILELREHYAGEDRTVQSAPPKTEEGAR